jgi:hypothetical protein
MGCIAYRDKKVVGVFVHFVRHFNWDYSYFRGLEAHRSLLQM